MYRTADAEIARFPTYRAYLNVSITAQMISYDAISNFTQEYKANATAKADMVAQRKCLAKP